ncbi:MAG: hypothetical protein ACKO96_30555 [Flammeovirgaceae bacterium]
MGLFSVSTFGQTAEEKLKEISDQFYLLKRQITTEDSLKYISTKFAILNSIQNGPKLEFDFRQVKDKIKISGLFAKIGKANNPTDDILGVSFVDVVSKAAETHLLASLPAADRPRFSEIVDKIIKNPIIGSLLNSNPVTSVVASITNSAANFFNSNIAGTKFDNARIETKNLFDQKKIESFNLELAPYISFYDKMLANTDKYVFGLEQLDRKYNFLNAAVKNYNNNLLSTLGVNPKIPTPLSSQVESILVVNKDVYDFYDYKKVLSQENVIKSKRIADDFQILNNQVLDFQNDYNELLKNYLFETIKLLNDAKSMKLSKGFNQAKLDGLIGEISEYIQTLDVDASKTKSNKMKLDELKGVKINSFK